MDTMVTLGDKIKFYEAKTRNYLPLEDNMHYVLRCDGRGFSSFCKGLEKPFDNIFRTAMELTMLDLCKEVQGAYIGYTQSDEITVIFKKMNPDSDIYFKGGIQKIASTVASKATLSFNKHFAAQVDKHAPGDDVYEAHKYIAEFDCRVFAVPVEEAHKVIVWRIQDCYKNAVQMITRCYYTQKQINNKTVDDMVKLLLDERNVNVDFDYPDSVLKGIIAYKDSVVINQGTDKEAYRNKWFSKSVSSFDMKEYMTKYTFI